MASSPIRTGTPPSASPYAPPASPGAPPPRPRRSTSIIGEYVREVVPDRVFGTIWGLLRDHRRFFDEVFAGDWRGKSHPIPFYLAAFSLMALAGKMAPEPPREVPWTVPYRQLTQPEKVAFHRALGMRVLFDPRWGPVTIEQATMHVSGVVRGPRTAVAHPDSLRAEEVAKYLAGKGQRTLSLVFEKAHLERQSNLLALRERREVPEWMIYVMLPLIALPGWRLMHVFLKAPHRTPKQTVYTFMYASALWSLFGGVPTALAGEHAERLPLAVVGMVAMLWFFFVKQPQIFRYTHGVGFRAFWWAVTKGGLVIVAAIFALATVAALVTS